MNIFYIPSWYPSTKNPIYGTFVKEQINLLARLNPDWNLGVSIWGQGDPAHMLWVRDHVKNMRKVIQHGRSSSFIDSHKNVHHVCSPTLTWTRKVLKGNLNGLIRANLKNLEQFRQHIGKVDVLHAQATYPGALLAQALSAKHKIPYVVSIRMSPFPFPEFLNKNGGLKTFISTPLMKADRILATSHSLESKLQGFGLTNVTVVHNPVDTDFFHSIEHSANELTLLSIGRMEEQKGFDLLIRAIAQLGTNFTGTVRMGGDGTFKEDYRKLAQELGVADKFIWLGELSREQVRDEMQRCSFYVLPSRHETFGNVLLEAIACGKPVLATRCRGPEDIVSAEVGMLIENENINALAAGLTEMIHTYTSYRADILRNHVNRSFSPEQFASQMKVIYTDLF